MEHQSRKTSIEQGLALSVVIPTMDRPKLLEMAVRSALAMAPTGTEVVVVDDGATTPVDLPEELSDDRLRVIRNQGTKGAGATRNFGVASARGRRILFLDDDDLLVPGYSEWVAAQDGDYGFSATETFSGYDMPRDMPRFSPSATQRIEDIRPFRKQISGLGCGFWIDRDAFLNVGGIAEDLRVNEDTDFCIRLMAAGLSGIAAPNPGVMIRKHGENVAEAPHLTHSVIKRQRARYFETILQRNAEWLGTRPDATAFLRQRQIKLLAQGGDKADAWKVASSGETLLVRLQLTGGLLMQMAAARLKASPR